MNVAAIEGPVLRTERFELWKPQLDDLPGLVRLVEDEETRRFLGPTRADAANQWERLVRNAGGWALYGYGTFAVRRPGSDEIVATGGIFHSWRGFGAHYDDCPEAGWIVRADHWRQGVARELMDAALGWFDSGFGPRRIVCMIENGNAASERLAQVLGFRRYDEMVAEGDRLTLGLYERV